MFGGGGFPLGSIVVFRYTSRTAHDRIPTVFVLAQNYQGYLHGLNVRYLSPDIQRQIQWYFMPQQQQQQTTDPFQAQQQEYQKKLQQYQQQKQEQLQKQTGVVVKPTTGSIFGVSTWKITQKEAVGKPPLQITSSIQEPAPPNVIVPPRPTPFSTQKHIPKDPYAFYHNVVKPLLGSNVKNVYRKYTNVYIHNIRLIKGVRNF